ncbi:MAG: type II toxin-antitoxin system VapC family toxin [Promethearchaeota archaeon]
MEKYVVDINCFAIYFVKDHPGHEFVKEILDLGLKGTPLLIIPEIIPFRAYWILTTKWKVSKEDAKEIIHDFCRNYSNPRYVGLTRHSIAMAIEFSNKLHHNVYDCYYLAVAKQEEATAILTTDTDFEKLCEKTSLHYVNPVPLEILKKFHAYK